MAKSTKTTDTVENVTVTSEAVENVVGCETPTQQIENKATEDNTVINTLSLSKDLYYTKKQLLSNNNYKRYADLINVLFDENKKYTKKQVDELLNREVR